MSSWSLVFIPPSSTPSGDTENIRRKVAEYRIKHPVINDAKMTLWNRFHVNVWPTLVLINARGFPAGAFHGEGNYEVGRLTTRSPRSSKTPGLGVN